ncbi:hypothetical protein EDC01DRAFT_626136 [Geopyxis carbonaria]|nr:hypothetical protein EDC01DRAFT_626136 [Geopyxis carbonaria]
MFCKDTVSRHHSGAQFDLVEIIPVNDAETIDVDRYAGKPWPWVRAQFLQIDTLLIIFYTLLHFDSVTALLDGSASFSASFALFCYFKRPQPFRLSPSVQPAHLHYSAPQYLSTLLCFLYTSHSYCAPFEHRHSPLTRKRPSNMLPSRKQAPFSGTQVRSIGTQTARHRPRPVNLLELPLPASLTASHLSVGHFYTARAFTPDYSAPWRTVLLAALDAPTHRASVFICDLLTPPAQAALVAVPHRWVALEGTFVRPLQPPQTVALTGRLPWNRYVCFSHRICLRLPSSSTIEDPGVSVAVRNLPYLLRLHDDYWRGVRYSTTNSRISPENRVLRSIKQFFWPTVPPRAKPNISSPTRLQHTRHVPLPREPYPKLRVLLRHASTQTDGTYKEIQSEAEVAAVPNDRGYSQARIRHAGAYTAIQLDSHDDSAFAWSLELELLRLLGLQEGEEEMRVWIELFPLYMAPARIQG